MLEVIASSNWNFVLYQDNQRYLLSTVCGGVGVYEVNIVLTPQEVSDYLSQSNFLQNLSDKIRMSPDKFMNRHIKGDISMFTSIPRNSEKN